MISVTDSKVRIHRGVNIKYRPGVQDRRLIIGLTIYAGQHSWLKVHWSAFGYAGYHCQACYDKLQYQWIYNPATNIRFGEAIFGK